MKLIHYGDDQFSLEKFEPIRNTSWCKPEGGLWTSPVDSEHSWIRWCTAEQFKHSETDPHFVFDLTTQRICVVSSYHDLERLPMQERDVKYTPSWMTPCIDFEILAKKYDAFHLTAAGERNTRWTRPFSLYGWDCETVLILNPAVVQLG